jgi:hypothetical protein
VTAQADIEQLLAENDLISRLRARMWAEVEPVHSISGMFIYNVKKSKSRINSIAARTTRKAGRLPVHNG